MWKFWIDVEHTPAAYSKNSWSKYKWWAWRNPTNGMKKWFKQPVLEVKPNPDETVRSGLANSDSRWMTEHLYWEYWYLSKIDWTIRGRHYKWFEFRIGWKFVDGNDEFFPTFQLGPRSS